jgi:hypothetical protein
MSFGALQRAGPYVVDDEQWPNVIYSQSPPDLPKESLSGMRFSRAVPVVRNGMKRETVSGERFTLPTVPGESIELLKRP